MIQAGRMKLDELHICYTTARAPGHGNAIAGTGIGVTGVKINFGGSPGSQHHVPGRARTYRARSLVEHVQTHAAIWATLSELGSADQIDGNTLLQHRNVRLAAHPVLQGANNCPAGGILGVEDAPVAVAALAREVVPGSAIGAVFVTERDPLRDQPARRVRTVSNYVFYRLAVTQPGPGAEGVLDMGCQRVSTFVQYRGEIPPWA